MSETNIRKYFLENRKSKPVRYKLKALTVNLAVAQKERLEQMKTMSVNNSPYSISMGSLL